MRGLGPITKETLLEHANVLESGCWIWRHSTDSHGYGHAGAVGGKRRYAHRVVFELFHGPIPLGGFVCHRCDTPSCVRPGHLYLGDARSNNRDAVFRDRRRGRVSPDIVWAIRHHADVPIHVLAKNFGISATAAFQIRSGKSRSST